MKLAIVQADLFWENPVENRAHLSKLIDEVEADVFVFPEMFVSGFTMNTESVAETMDGKTVQWAKDLAKNKNAVITGSIIIEEEGSYFNRMIWVEPNGKVVTYDKRHLFRMANEQNYFSSGKEKRIVEYKGVKFCLMVCYDLRFPVWSRNLESNNSNPEYDCLIYVANWPSVRSSAWKVLLQARAIENQCYVVGVNRVGVDGNEKLYSGDSRIFSPKGDRMDNIEPNKEMVNVVEIDLDSLERFRDKFPVMKDSDKFEILDI